MYAYWWSELKSILNIGLNIDITRSECTNSFNIVQNRYLGLQRFTNSPEENMPMHLSDGTLSGSCDPPLMMSNCVVINRLEAIMLKILPNILFCNSYSFKKSKFLNFAQISSTLMSSTEKKLFKNQDLYINLVAAVASCLLKLLLAV